MLLISDRDVGLLITDRDVGPKAMKGEAGASMVPVVGFTTYVLALARILWWLKKRAMARIRRVH